MSIEDFSEEELFAEIERRNRDAERLRLEFEKMRDEGRKASRPVQLPNPNFAAVIAECQGYIDSVAENGAGEELDDVEKWIAEAALKAVFGPDVFIWVNSYIE